MILKGIFGKFLLNWTIVFQIKTLHHYQLSLSPYSHLPAYDINTQTYVPIYMFSRQAYLLKLISDRKPARNHLVDT